MKSRCFSWCLTLVAALPGGASVRADETFEKDVRPLLIRNCIQCHGPEKQKGGLRLDSRAGRQKGGTSGPVILPGKPEESLLLKAVQGKDGVKAMPPKGKLSQRELRILTQWIKDGAKDSPDSDPVRLGGMSLEAAKKWWAFQPVRRPEVPSGQFINPIDAFVATRLRERNLTLSPAADKRTLIRRATYDLTGLPPTYEEIHAFLNDNSPNAFARVVDRMLGSPAYGEHWGQHWLDLVRYADTAGENSDHPLPHAWRYRNWVIDSFNRDQPYDEFLREQIAGDILAARGAPDQYASRIIATGYLALARRFEHDSDKHMHLTHEDGIDTLGKAFLGLTLGCARCHDHKYDAVSTRDYYSLYGIFESTKFAFPGCEAKQQPRDLVPLIPPEEWNRRVRPYQEKLAQLDTQIQALRAEQQKLAQDVQAIWVKSRQPLSQGEIPDRGEKTFDSGPSPVEVHAGDVVLLSVTPLKNHGADTTLVEFELTEVGGQMRKWNATRDLVSDLLAGNPHRDGQGNSSVWWFFDLRNQPTLLPEAVASVAGKSGLHAWRNGDTPSVLVNSSNMEVQAWTKLSPRSLFVHPSANGNVGLAWLSPITGKITIKGRIKDAHPGGPDGVGWVLERFAADVRRPLLAQVDSSRKLESLVRSRADLTKSAPKQEVAFAVVEGRPADTRLQLRGDPEKLGEVVPRRWLEALGSTPIADKATSGRLDLAKWIASPDNPLTARVMVNRIWLHHFGKGLVKTPNDFGTRGAPPSHPELLDWLASEFVRSNWSIKAMHRMILLSETYRQSSAWREDAARIDPANDLHWRFERRRLSAEELRDSLLTASAGLDRRPAEAHPFPPESAWSYTQHVPFSTFFDTNKRSVYLIRIRNRRHPFLGLFDGADPNATTPERQTTTVPTQALFFMNDPFFHAQAARLAERVLSKPERERVGELFRIALQREPTPEDRAFAARFLGKYQELQGNSQDARTAKESWSALARIILASNEFLFVE